MITKFKLFENNIDPWGEEDWDDNNFDKSLNIDTDEFHMFGMSEPSWDAVDHRCL